MFVIFLFALLHALGIPQDIEFPSCPCEGVVVNLIKFQYWPGSPANPLIAFSFSLLDMLEALLLECQVAVQDFTQAITYLIKCKIFKVRMFICVVLCTTCVSAKSFVTIQYLIYPCTSTALVLEKELQVFNFRDFWCKSLHGYIYPWFFYHFRLP